MSDIFYVQRHTNYISLLSVRFAVVTSTVTDMAMTRDVVVMSDVIRHSVQNYITLHSQGHVGKGKV
jgi:hypothetical protein